MTLPLRYRNTLRMLLTQAERAVFERLSSPDKIQNFLDSIAINFEIGGDTHLSPRRVLRERRAHCTEGALLAAACLAYHGEMPMLMDLRALPADQDHVIALFRDRGLWGAISKTNHGVLRWRDAIYRSPRELAMSYAHEYYLRSGRKSLLSYSLPYRLSRHAPDRWVTEEANLDWLIADLDDSPHRPVAPPAALGRRRRASALERFAGELTEWVAPAKRPGKRGRKTGSKGPTRPFGWRPRKAPAN